MNKSDRLKKASEKTKSSEVIEDLTYEEKEVKVVDKQKRTNELTFKKLQLKNQILLRPDTYIGSTKKVKSFDPIWVLDKDKFVQKQVAFTEGFVRLFIECISNAIDNVWRSDEFKIPCKFIKVTIDPKENIFSIWNDGKTIPIEKHKEENIHIPELIFGNLLTSSNYNDSEERKTSGKNGLGIKCNSKGTIIPLYKGIYKPIEKIKIGEKIIGPDGEPRTVVNISNGKGKMYRVVQQRGMNYEVNDEHILTLRMPDHKVIFWNSNDYCWTMLYWEHKTKSIVSKSIHIPKNLDECEYHNCKVDNCGKKYLSRGKLVQHYQRHHPNDKIPKPKSRKSPTVNPIMTKEIQEARYELELFAKNIPDDNTIDISIKEYMKLNKTTKGRLSGFKGSGVNWNKKEVKLDPYILGMWLGDGLSTGDGFSSEDNDLIIKWVEWSKENNCEVVHSGKYRFRIRSNLSKVSKPSITETSNIECTGCKHKICTLCSDDTFKNKYNAPIIRSKTNPLKEVLSHYNLIDNKHIPRDYLINDRETRLKVLAGLIDTDGSASREGTRIMISQCVAHEQLIRETYFLAQSLGFSCSLNKRTASYTYEGEKKYKECFSLNISGDIEQIPTVLQRKKCKDSYRRETLNTGPIKIEEIEEEKEFVGLTIDGDQRFVLEDFTVTHNCSNIFSTEFSVECFNPDKGIYKQTWENNMDKVSEPVIDTVKAHYPKKIEDGKNGYTKVSWKPELSRFDMKEVDKETMSVIEKYIIDCAMTVYKYGVKIIYNDKEILMKDYKDYIKYYFKELPDEFLMLNQPENTCILCPSSEFTQVSFVNGIHTKDGGVHVDAWCEQLFRPLLNKLNEKTKKFDMRDIKKHFFIFVNCSLDKPRFDNQSKN